MKSISKWFMCFLNDKSGKVPIEYAVAIALIAGGVIYGLTNMGGAVSNQNNATSNMLNGGPIPGSSTASTNYAPAGSTTTTAGSTTTTAGSTTFTTAGS